jgi:AraC-like DNA-binding protein
VSSLFTTDKIAKAKRFDVWRDMLCSTHVSIDCQRLTQRPFSGASEAAQINQVGLTRIHSVDQKIVWTPLRPSTNDGALLVTLQTVGVGVLVQDGHEEHLEPGSVSFHESGRPFSWIFPDEFEQLVIRLPRETFAGRLGHTSRWTARVMSGTSGIGSLVSGFLRHTFVVLGSCSPSSAYRLSQISCDLVGTALAEIQGQEKPSQYGRIALLLRAKQVIETHLPDPELNPAKVASMLRISLRYLQELFKNENTTPSAWMWERRLIRSHNMLADARFANVSISQIAFDCGFNDYSHFNHRFRAAFSASPSEFRDNTCKDVDPRLK